MSTAVVVDASAAVEILLKTAKGAGLKQSFRLRRSSGCPRCISSRWRPYCGALLASHITTARATAALSRLLVAPLRRVQVKPLLDEAWSLRHNLTVPDALYVVLARHLDAPLVTADIKLANAPGLGIIVIQP